MGVFAGQWVWWSNSLLFAGDLQIPSCEVKVSKMMSDSLAVSSGLRQECVLSPLLLSVYANSLVEKLRGWG